MRVFVSSTYIDLKEHRAAVEDVLQRLGSTYHGMEYFGARHEEPTSASFAEIAQCELFIGIYAHRYGHVPSAGTHSITEQEYDFACGKRLPILCYLVESEHPWPANMIDPNRELALRPFLDRIQADLVCCFFTTPNDLAKKVAADVGRYLVKTGSASEGSLVAQYLHRALAGKPHRFIGRPHLLQVLIDSPSFRSSYLSQFQLEPADLASGLEELLARIRETPDTAHVRWSLSAQQLSARAEELRRSGFPTAVEDCLWQALAEDHAGLLRRQPRELKGSDRRWLEFVSDAGLSTALQLSTPYLSDEADE